MRLLLVLAVLLGGCGTRTALTVEARDAGPRDADVRRDAGRRDAGRRDAGHDGGPRLRDAGPRGERCSNDADCAVGVCRGSVGDAPRDLDPLRLFCGAGKPDPSGAPGSPCLERTTCDRHLCTVSGTCVMPCRSDADCGGAERCREAWVQTSEASMESLMACTARLAIPDTVRATAPMAGPSLSEVPRVSTLPELVPNGLAIWEGPAGSQPLIERIETRGPGADTVFDIFSPRVPGDPGPSWGIGPATVGELVTLMLPNGPGTPLPAEGHDVFLSSTVRGPSELTILQRREVGTSFDIDAYLVGGGGWRIRRPGEVPAPIEAAFGALREMLGGFGLSVGEIRAHEVVGGLRRRFEVLEGEEGLLGVPPDLPRLYRLSAGAVRPSVSVFFVRMIDGALGIASGIPGPHGMPGTGASGVAISVDLIPESELPLVILHEMGHFMGLFHTTEADGSISEPLTDTAECGPENDSDLDGFLIPSECAAFGADNVMFWTGEGGMMSPQQGELMGRAYFVR